MVDFVHIVTGDILQVELKSGLNLNVEVQRIVKIGEKQKLTEDSKEWSLHAISLESKEIPIQKIFEGDILQLNKYTINSMTKR